MWHFFHPQIKLRQTAKRLIWQIIKTGSVDQLGTTTTQNSEWRGNAPQTEYTTSICILPVAQELFVFVPSLVGTGYEAQGQDQEDEREGDDSQTNSYEEGSGYKTFPRIMRRALTVQDILLTEKRN